MITRGSVLAKADDINYPKAASVSEASPPGPSNYGATSFVPIIERTLALDFTFRPEAV